MGLCGQGCRAGREGEPLASSVYLEAEIMARPDCCSSGRFHARANGMGSAMLHPCSMHPAMGIQDLVVLLSFDVTAMGMQDLVVLLPFDVPAMRMQDLVVLLSLDVPAWCQTLLPTTVGEPEPGEGCGHGAQAIREVGDTAGHPLPCGITVAQGSTGFLSMCPHAGWVPTLAACPHAVHGSPSLVSCPWTGRVPILAAYRSTTWVSTLAALTPSVLSTRAACPCTVLSSLCRLCIPAPAASLYQQCPLGGDMGATKGETWEQRWERGATHASGGLCPCVSQDRQPHVSCRGGKGDDSVFIGAWMRRD